MSALHASSAEPVLTERVATAAQMVRQHGVTPSQAAACLRVPVASVQIALGRWTNLRGRA